LIEILLTRDTYLLPMSRRKPQLSFLPPLQLNHGGTTRAGLRKIARPIDPKRAMHVTLKSAKAKGPLSLLRPQHSKRIEQKLRELARRYDIRVYQFANSGNHFHILLKGRTRRSIQSFMKALGSQIAQLVTRAKKGSAFGKFWDATFFSRVVNWGRDFVEMRFYILKNELEAEGWTEHDRTPKARRGKSPRAAHVFAASFGRGI
jgi:REP element-mobilizing transposase RayT